MLMIEPDFCLIICREISFVNKIVPTRLVLRIWCRFSLEETSNSLLKVTPAELTKMSIDCFDSVDVAINSLQA